MHSEVLIQAMYSISRTNNKYTNSVDVFVHSRQTENSRTVIKSQL